MKRTDIVLGQDYVVSGRQEWERSIYSTSRKRVISLGNWHPRASGYGTGRTESLTYEGQAFTVWNAFNRGDLTKAFPLGRAHVVVAGYNEDGTLNTTAEAVPASHVRCSWEQGQEVTREADAARAHNDQLRREAEERREARIAAATDARSRLQAYVDEVERVNANIRGALYADEIHSLNGFEVRISDIKTLLQNGR